MIPEDTDDTQYREHHRGVIRWYGIILIALAVLAAVWSTWQ